MKYFFILVTISFSILSCSVNKAKIDNSLKKYFDAQNVDGCFTLLRNTDGEITVYNMALDTQRFQPSSGFNMFNSLVALQTGRVTGDDMVIRWDGIKRQNNWNRNFDLKSAFKSNATPYFQEVARRIGKDTMQLWLDSLSYGNQMMSASIDSFWLDNSLKISPDEQLGLLKKLYFDQLPLRKSVMQSVRDAMVQVDNTAYKLSYISATGISSTQSPLGWVIGWIEENRHVYFFVTFVKSDKAKELSSIQVDITKDILKQYGFFEGKM